MNVIGVFAVAGFILGFVGAVVSWFLFKIHILLVAHEDPLWVWKDSQARWRFLTFVGSCAFGVLSMLAGLLFGGLSQ